MIHNDTDDYHITNDLAIYQNFFFLQIYQKYDRANKTTKVTFKFGKPPIPAFDGHVNFLQRHLIKVSEELLQFVKILKKKKIMHSNQRSIYDNLYITLSLTLLRTEIPIPPGKVRMMQKRGFVSVPFESSFYNYTRSHPKEGFSK